MKYLSQLWHRNECNESTICCKPENTSLCQENILRWSVSASFSICSWVWPHSFVGGMRTALISCDMNSDGRPFKSHRSLWHATVVFSGRITLLKIVSTIRLETCAARSRGPLLRDSWLNLLVWRDWPWADCQFFGFLSWILGSECCVWHFDVSDIF